LKLLWMLGTDSSTRICWQHPYRNKLLNYQQQLISYCASESFYAEKGLNIEGDLVGALKGRVCKWLGH